MQDNKHIDRYTMKKDARDKVNYLLIHQCFRNAANNNNNNNNFRLISQLTIRNCYNKLPRRTAYKTGTQSLSCPCR